MKIQRWQSVLLMALLACTTVFPQTTGRLSGSLVDQTGAAVPGATVNLLLAGGASPVLTAQTSSDGIFAFTALNPGSYDLEIVATGFAKLISRGVKVDPARETPVGALQLEVQSTNQTVEVSANAQTVQVANAEIATTVTQKQIQSLPVLDRQISNLFITQPGVSVGRGNTVINGLRTSAASVTLDGVNIQDNFIRTNSLDYIPNKTTIEQVAEFTIATSNASIATGGSAAQIVLSTPSGSNSYHGSLYWYNRNSFFSANDWFNNKNGVGVPFLNQNQVGGSAGGKIIRDKLFFYTNYEAFRLRQQTPENNTVLTPSAKTGIMQYRAGGVLRSANVLSLRNVQIDPSMAALISQLPNPNNTDVGDGLNTAGYQFNARDNEDRNVFLLRSDYYLSSRHSFTGTYSYNTDLVDRPDLGSFYTTVPPTFNDNKANLFSGAWRWTVTPTFTNEVRAGFNLPPGTFNVSNKYPTYYLSNTNLLFTNPVNTFQAQGRQTNTYTVQDNASWVKGRHTIFMGYQSQYIRTNPYNDVGIVPTYTLGISSANNTGLSTADLPGISGSDLNIANNLYTNLAGIISGYSQTFNVKDRTSGFVNGATNQRNFRYDTYAGYFSDQWKIKPRLTLTLGLRYEYWTPLDERDALYLAPALENGNVINTILDPNAKLDFIGSAVGRSFYKPDKNNFAPNIGFAWDPRGNGKTAVRGGYAISYINDDTITTIRNSVATSSGLQSLVTNSNVVGRLAAAPAIPTPAFKVPRTLADNYALDSTSATGIPDPNLVTPYVQQYNFGIQQEIKGTILEVRYVGNHLVKGLRGIDYNQVNINAGGFLADFKRAQQNGLLSQAATGRFDPRYNANISGSQPTPVFNSLPGGGLLTNATVLAYIRQGEPGTLAQLYQTNGLNGDINFFPNPNILGGNVITNYTNSSYNSLQTDLRHRTANGHYQWQINYTWAKVLSDAAGDGQTRFEPFLDNNNAAIERSVAPYDLRHVFKGNYALDLPFGKGRHFDINNRILDAIAGGWTAAGIFYVQSGTPYSVLSTRGTLNRGARSANNTAVAVGDLSNVTGLFMTGNGPYFINPANLNPSDKRGVAPDGSAPFAGQVFYNPGAGTLGSLQRRMFNGPWNRNWDASLLKTFRITERQTLQFRADAFNLLNHPTFYVGNESNNSTRFNVNSTTFGRITSTFNSSRVMQFGLYYRF